MNCLKVSVTSGALSQGDWLATVTKWRWRHQPDLIWSREQNCLPETFPIVWTVHATCRWDKIKIDLCVIGNVAPCDHKSLCQVFARKFSIAPWSTSPRDQRLSLLASCDRTYLRIYNSGRNRNLVWIPFLHTLTQMPSSFNPVRSI